MKWSYSAHQAMRRCQRALIFGHSMASATARDTDRREAYILKQLRQLPMWQGSLVHEVLSSQLMADLRAGRPPRASVLTARAQELARRQFAFSAAKRYRDPGQTKRAAGDDYCALYEHEYGLPVPDNALAVIDANLARCFQNLASQTEFLAALRAGHEHEAERQLSFHLAFGLPTATATLDLVFVRPDGSPTIVDWKVSSNTARDYHRQLLVYALALSRCGRWPQLAPEAIELYEVNLLANRMSRHPVTATLLEETEDWVYRSLLELAALTDGLPFEELDLSDFEVAERPVTCQWCNFRPLCLRLLEQAARPPAPIAIQGSLW